MLDYRKPQPRAACLFRAALVGAVEPLEHPVKVFGRDSDACIGNRDDRLVFFFADGHTDFAARFGVTERIVAKIVNYLVQKSANARHGNFFAADGNFDVFILCGRRKRTDFLFRKREQVNFFFRELRVFVKLRKPDDVIDKRNEPRRFRVYSRNEARHIFRFDKPVFHKFRAAHYRVQRRFQFVRNVCRKFASVSFRKRFFGYIENQKHGAARIRRCSYTACVHLIYFAVSFRL